MPFLSISPAHSYLLIV